MTTRGAHTSTMPQIIAEIIAQNDGELLGTEKLANEARSLNNKSYVLRAAKRAAGMGLIVIVKSTGGRGHRTVYRCTPHKCSDCSCACQHKRNPNQPGVPRKVRHE